jgi:hypothetical protein
MNMRRQIRSKSALGTPELATSLIEGSCQLTTLSLRDTMWSHSGSKSDHGIRFLPGLRDEGDRLTDSQLLLGERTLDMDL